MFLTYQSGFGTRNIYLFDIFSIVYVSARIRGVKRRCMYTFYFVLSLVTCLARSPTMRERIYCMFCLGKLEESLRGPPGPRLLIKFWIIGTVLDRLPNSPFCKSLFARQDLSVCFLYYNVTAGALLLFPKFGICFVCTYIIIVIDFGKFHQEILMETPWDVWKRGALRANDSPIQRIFPEWKSSSFVVQISIFCTQGGRNPIKKYMRRNQMGNAIMTDRSDGKNFPANNEFPYFFHVWNVTQAERSFVRQ